MTAIKACHSLLQVRYIYSACQEITSESGFTLLIDPWFHNGAFHGSWCLTHEPAKLTKKPDAVWISHIHPDHYCPQTLRDIGITEAYISAGSKYLSLAMRRDGFIPNELKPEWARLADDMEVCALQYDDIDSALLVRCGGHTVLFYVDTPNDDAFIARIMEKASPHIDVAYLPYAGGGPWPQCFDMSPEQMEIEAEKKKSKLLNNTVSLWTKLGNPSVVIYAGEYVLGGPLARLNKYRGAPTRSEANNILKKTIYNLCDEADIGSSLGLYKWNQSNQRAATHSCGKPWPGPTERYRPLWGERYGYRGFDYQGGYSDLFEDVPIGSHGMSRVFNACYKNMIKKKELFLGCEREEMAKWTIYFHIEKNVYAAPLTDEADRIGDKSINIFCSSSIFLSAALGITHWNNLEVGSHLRFSRTPDEYCRPLHRLLSFFHI